MDYENCLRCNQKINSGILCKGCQEWDKKLAKFERDMAQKGYAHIETLCSVCSSTSVYMNADEIVYCPVCEMEIDPSRLVGEQTCLKCGTEQEVNFVTGAANCFLAECESSEFGPTPFERIRAGLNESLTQASRAVSETPIESSSAKMRQKVMGALVLPFLLLWTFIRTPFGLGVALGVGLVIWIANGSTAPGSVDNKEEAIANCQVAIESQLSDPSSANFPSNKAEKTSRGWVVTGMVSARNGFGARVSRVYVCTINDDQIQVSVR